MEKEELREYGNPGLGEIAEFIFILLGSFCEENGFSTDLRKDYISEPKTEFGKYNISDGQSEISKLIKRFRKTVFEDYDSFESKYLLDFPKFLVDSILHLINVYGRPKNELLQVLLSYYFAYLVYSRKNCPDEKDYCKAVSEMINETYADIKKTYPKFDFSNISEKAKWGSVKDYLNEIKQIDCAKEEKAEFSTRLLRHYLFLNFKKALIKIFGMQESCEDTFTEIADNISLLASSVGTKIAFAPSQNADGIYDILQPVEMFRDSEKQSQFQQIIDKIGNDSLSTFKPVTASSASYQYNVLSGNLFSGEEAVNFYRNWLKARSLIFTLSFENGERDKIQISEALALYKESFDKYKYFAGGSLREFLTDAIAADVYFNRKNLKDIIANSQDDTGESSILKPGKSYWEFGYAIGLLPENSQKTYLCAFNAEKNFWNAFPVPKFECFDKAFEKYKEDISNEELNILNITENLSDKKKIDNLLLKDRTDTRQKLGKRQYNNLSIAILRAETSFDFENIKNYISASPIKNLINTNESGATPLIRALDVYKNYVYGFSKEYRKNRAKILSEYQEKIDSFYELIKEKFPDADFDDENLIAIRNEKFDEYIDNMLENIKAAFDTYDFKSENMQLHKKAELLKTNVIIPLIKKMGTPEFSNHLLDEAIQEDIRHCVSALQLAIDSFDGELVSAILENLPDKKRNLAKLYISEEYTNPLQYAIRKNDLLMQSYDKFPGKTALFTPLYIPEIPPKKITNGGILPEDRSWFAAYEGYFFNYVKALPFEECGILYDESVFLHHQKNLKKIIELLTEKMRNKEKCRVIE